MELTSGPDQHLERSGDVCPTIKVCMLYYEEHHLELNFSHTQRQEDVVHAPNSSL